MNLRAASNARNWSPIGMALRSKYRASKRRSRYRTSPGFSGSIWLVGSFASGTAFTGCTSTVAGAGIASFWNSKNLMACGAPSSVTVKSLAVRPSTGWPLLSVTETVSITNCVLA
jgi:hypothetical protein